MLKNIYAILLVLTIIVNQSSANEINWNNRIDVAIEKAKYTQTPILVFVYSNTCHYCAKAIKDFDDDDLKSILSDENKITLVAVNVNDTKQLQKYDLEINMYPTYFLLSSGGRKISKPLEGYLELSNLKMILRQTMQWYVGDVAKWYNENSSKN